MRRKLDVLGEYIGHLVVGTAMFATLLLFRVALHLLVEWAEPLVADRAFLQLMMVVEKVMLYSDVVFIVWWTTYSTYRAIEGLHDE
jgi:hypothetical protein